VCIFHSVEGGELYDRIIKVGKFSEAEALFIFRQIYLAVNYMHRQGIIHRDLKVSA
jgi:serine/threonine protein kinase